MIGMKRKYILAACLLFTSMMALPVSTKRICCVETEQMHQLDKVSSQNIDGATSFIEQTVPNSQEDKRVLATVALLKEEQSSKKQLKLVEKALKDKDRDYRMGVLKAYSNYVDEEGYIKILKSTLKASSTVRTDVFNWLRDEASDPQKKTLLQRLEIRFDRPLAQELISTLNDRDYALREAAAWAMTAIGNQQSIAALAGLLKSEDTQMIALAESTLSEYPLDVTPAVAKVLPRASEGGQIVGVTLLALREADAYITSVYELIRGGSPKVKRAAYESLPALAREKDFTTLCGMLELSDEEYVKPLQDAVVRSLAHTEPSKRTEISIRRFFQAEESKRHLFYPLLLSTEDPKALELIPERAR